MSTQPDIGLTPAKPIADDEKAEFDFLRHEAGYLQDRLARLENQLEEVESQLDEVALERDSIRHERNLMAQDFSWTLNRLASSPAGPLLARSKGFQRMIETWGHAAD